MLGLMLAIFLHVQSHLLCASSGKMPFQDIVFHKALLLSSEFQGLFPKCVFFRGKQELILEKRQIAIGTKA